MIKVTAEPVFPKFKKPDYPVLLRNSAYRDMLVLAVRKSPREQGMFEGIVLQGTENVEAKYKFGDWLCVYHSAYEAADDMSVTIKND